ncbi:hypothetical protein [uncultured Cellulomonas sp.]|uniref:hypothetical protein n=1 Tax=uncultured Cellulomonas sp. TaxID=189682 RepID=UPI0028E3BEFA|nr:hypothetical protein [uncultured Cellulomonas sp.]
MQDALDSTSSDEPDGGVQNAADSGLTDGLAPDANTDQEPTTALIEVLPGVAVVFGKVPEALQLDLVDFGLVPATDRMLLTTTLASLVGNSATVGGSIANAMSSAQGLYRVNSATQALLNNGAVLAVKDGANLGSVWMNGELVAQARFIPLTAASAATVAVAIGPAVAMVALQMQLNQITGLVRTNIALTNQVLTEIRQGRWDELTGHVAAIDRALNQARELESVPPSLWDTVSGNGAPLRTQLDRYRRNVGNHVTKIERLDTGARRQYLDTNAEAILFDSHALMSSLQAWTGYQALHAGKARTAGAEDPDEARLVDIIVRDTRNELEPALSEATHLVDDLTRELQIIAEVPGRRTIPVGRRRRDSNSARLTSTQLLKVIEPLADALRPPAPSVEAPGIVCALKGLDLAPYLRVLRWFVGQDETLRCIAFCYQRDEGDVVRAVGQSVLSRIDPEGWATVVAVTDHRILTARANTLRQEAKIGRRILLDDVRYVRARTAKGEGGRSEVDLVARDVDLRWAFHPDTDDVQILAFAAVLAESMRLPESERDALIKPNAQLAAAEGPASVGTTSSMPASSEDESAE